MEVDRHSSRGFPAIEVLAIAAVAFAVFMAAWGHTETGPVSDPDCPACQLVTSQVSTAGITLAVTMPVLQPVVTPPPSRTSAPLEPYAARESSRAPPSALES
jgi:hypothetical protein